MDWLIGVVPLALVVLMCPLMMIVMMMRGMQSAMEIRQGVRRIRQMGGSRSSSSK